MLNYLRKNLITSMVITLLCFATDGYAQKKRKSSDPAPTPAAPAKTPEKEKSITDVTKGTKLIPGLFPIYQDTATGAIRMIIAENQLNEEFILFSHVMNGIVDAGYFRGAYRNAYIFKVQKYFDKIEFVKENVGFYFDPENPLSRSANANVNRSVMFSEKIEATDKSNKTYLIKCEGLFLKETLAQIKPPRLPNTPPTVFSLGNLDKDKSKISDIRNYPENSDVLVEYVYSQDAPINQGTPAVTDPRNISIQVLHSIIQVPQNDYEPRYDDPRVGYFATQVNDMTTTQAVTYRDVIHRWHLKKKDPSAALSEPVEPIVWWIENTTPLEFREVIRDAVLQWNKAFEKIGYKNAVQVKIQPDNATWDAGDIRYNVLRWASSPTPPFGGYGPSFVNPRTGQILGADVMLEFNHFRGNVAVSKLYGLTSFEEHAENELFDPLKVCSFGSMMHENNLFAEAVLLAEDADDLSLQNLKREAMMYLIMHEVGHTMGLNHNMKSSQLYSPEQLYNKDFINGKALAGSVMDYPAINITPDRTKQGQYHSVTLGPYDEWAIEFGYKPGINKQERNEILARSTKPELTFGNDADDMRTPGKAIDPRVNIGDMSNDQIRYSIDRITVVNEVMKKIKNKYNTEGQTYQELRQSFFVLTNQYHTSLSVISRFIGGVYVDRAVIGQAGGTKPLTPVSYADQKKAMNALAKYAFAPDAYQVPNDLLAYLTLQRRGFNFFALTEDPKLHNRVITSQRNVLSHLLHVNTLQRIVDSQLYGNAYALSEVMGDLHSAIFNADINGNINSFRQNLQLEYVKMLIDITTSKSQYPNQARSMAVFLLKDTNRKLNTGGDVLTRAHKEHLRTLINNALAEIK
jgi:hypothetical protein